MKPFVLGSRATLRDLVGVARRGRPVRLPAAARAKIAAARKLLLRRAAEAEPVYGVNTGFGELASRRIAAKDLAQLQVNLVRSHAAGVGEPLSPEASLGILFLRANELAYGHSGCRPEVVEALVALVNRGVAPVIPSRGSLGASGDLAPQAHAALVLLGDGEARVREGKAWGPAISGAAALRAAGVAPLRLEAKEGLCLLNGTQAMQSAGGLALDDALSVLETANAAGAMSLEALKGTTVPFEEALNGLKPHRGQIRVAARLRWLLRDSAIRESHRHNDPRVQDSYSLRCMPQVHGAVDDALHYAVQTVETEMASCTDNPLLIDGRILSGGNFHGQALAFGFDLAAIALSALGGISERRVFQLMNGEGLPLFLADNPGLESGYMIAQYTAAALASENKVLAHPASADSIPSNANKEDFVSMGMGGALKLERSVRNVARIVAVELLSGAQAVERHRPLKPGTGVAQLLGRVRALVRRTVGDVPLGEPIERLASAVLAGRLADERPL
ncbi:MAG: histidine ammonia-lyase [Elusimicrobia bacterium]|nr:histidine ammonia-lyase [Elusimicrobiota bacterium]